MAATSPECVQEPMQLFTNSPVDPVGLPEDIAGIVSNKPRITVAIQRNYTESKRIVRVTAPQDNLLMVKVSGLKASVKDAALENYGKVVRVKIWHTKTFQ